MIFTTYIIKNTFTNKYYIGSTNNINRRLGEHNRGQNISTKRKGIWLLIYEETFNTNLEAKKREFQIKSYKGGNAFKKLLAGVVQQ